MQNEEDNVKPEYNVWKSILGIQEAYIEIDR
jgi:hypothetical protein